MKVAFKDDSFAFEFVRNLGFMYYGGSDLGEMIATAREVVEGDFESWFTAWNRRAQRVLARAEADLAAGHKVSARGGFLRASTYFRMAEFYVHVDPKDPRILSASRASQQAYAKAAKLIGPTWEPVQIPYEGTTLPGYFYKPDTSNTPRPTIIFHGGYDSSVEELFYYGGAPATMRGYNCLTWDGPGQGAPLREQKLPFRPDWEKVVSPAVDYALTRPDVDPDNLVLIGMSFGGYLAARAAAFEHRFRAAVFFDGVYDFHETLRKLLPKEAMEAYDSGDRAKCERIVQEKMAANTALRWTVTQGTWTFGVSGIADLIDQTKAYTVAGITDKIRCPCLVMEAADDIFFEGQPQQVFEELKVPKAYARFTAEDGAENHCQSGALAYKDEVVFNWIAETLGREPA
ncbi:dienelactone hydrolase [Ancylobacter sp. 3268]|uniref:alpha/beta hydrolase family protein n=1 Tax=Ancylobacter sp. 3268 TaxID=2817752 RepID=UPI00285F9F20|nr:alpha/beta fold hydrolase [Ancylobacter sp. 3268]MDR6955445.1 dienelactone hydrolase [Ancylobacter sp. 3268]